MVLDPAENAGDPTALPYDASEPLWRSGVGAARPPQTQSRDARVLALSAHPWNSSPTPLPPERSPFWIVVAAAAATTILTASAAIALWM
jgi:hypothetical protein